MYSETGKNWLCTVKLVRTDYVQWGWWELIMYSETGENFANLMQNDLNSLIDKDKHAAIVKCTKAYFIK